MNVMHSLASNDPFENVFMQTRIKEQLEENLLHLEIPIWASNITECLQQFSSEEMLQDGEAV